MKEYREFIKMVDDLIALSHMDKELEDGFTYIKNYLCKNGDDIYDVVFKMLCGEYKNNRIADWMNNTVVRKERTDV